MTTEKKKNQHIDLTIWTFVSKVMSLLFNTLSRFVIAFFPKEQESFNFVAAFTTEIDDPLYLRRLSQGVSRGS